MTALNILLALVLLADYLTLSISYVALGTKANWIVLVAIFQIVALGIAIAIGRGRGLKVSMPILGFAGLGILMLFHVGSRAVTSGNYDDYGTLKTGAFFLVSAPAFLLGCIAGRSARLPGGKWYPLLIAPLLLMCTLALVTNPEKMTVRRSEDLAVFLGVLVLPVHQALAFSMGKITLWLHATIQRRDESRVRIAVTLGLICTCLGFAILSGSRGYLLAAFVALAAQWCLGRKRIGWLVAVAWIPLAFYFGLSSDFVQRGLDPAVVMNSFSMRERFDLWQAAIDAFWHSPLLGHGPGGFATFHGWESRVYPHNLFLEILSEFGLAGLVCCLLIFIPISMRVLNTCLNGEDLTETQFFAVGFLVFSVVGAMGVADLIRNYFFFFAAGMTAVAFAPSQARARRKRELPQAATVT